MQAGYCSLYYYISITVIMNPHLLSVLYCLFTIFQEMKSFK